jgi:chorismate mutase
MSAILYVPVGTTVTVIEGSPPIDQSAEVAALQGQVAALTTERDDATNALALKTSEMEAAQAALTTALGERDGLAAKIAAAKVEADDVLREAQEARGALE